MLSNDMISTSFYYSHGDQTLVRWPYPQNVITTPGDDVLGDFTSITEALRRLGANLAANISPFFCISISAKLSLGVAHEIQKQELLLGVLLGTGLNLLSNLRDHLPNNMDDFKDRAREKYETASDRLGRATNALRGKEESRIFGKVGALLIGVGVGVGVGLLIAPASGEKTRADIADKVSDFGDKVREHTGKTPKAATGTYGE